jgi:hypothetical protein
MKIMQMLRRIFRVRASADRFLTLIERDVIRALNIIGSMQWQEAFEILKLSDTSWGVQCRDLIVPPIGRYEVSIVFYNKEPLYFEIIHSDGRGGFTATDTHDLSYNDLINTLNRVHREFGPFVISIPIH